MQRTIRLPVVVLAVAVQHLLIRYCWHIVNPMPLLASSVSAALPARIALGLLVAAAVVALFAVQACLCDGTAFTADALRRWMPRYGRWMRVVLLTAAAASVPLLPAFFAAIFLADPGTPQTAGGAVLLLAALLVLPVVLHAQFRLFFAPADGRGPLAGLKTQYLPLMLLAAVFLALRAALGLVPDGVPALVRLMLSALPGTLLHLVLLCRYHARGRQAIAYTVPADALRVWLCLCAALLLLAGSVVFAIAVPNGVVDGTRSVHILVHAVCTAFPLGVLGCCAARAIPAQCRIARRVAVAAVLLLCLFAAGRAVLNCFVPVIDSYRLVPFPFLT